MADITPSRKRIIKKIFGILLLCVSAITADSQGCIGIGLGMSVDYNYRTLYNEAGTMEMDLIKGVRDDIEVGLIGYTAGFVVSCELNSRLEVITGLHYSLKGMQTPKRRARFGFDPQTQVDEGYDYHFEYRMSYAELPLELRHYFTREELSFYGQLGIATSVFIEERYWLKKDYDDEGRKISRYTTQYDYKRINLSPTLGVGVRLMLGDWIELSFGPKVRYGVTKIIEAPLSATLWNIGMEATAVARVE